MKLKHMNKLKWLRPIIRTMVIFLMDKFDLVDNVCEHHITQNQTLLNLNSKVTYKDSPFSNLEFNDDSDLNDQSSLFP
jgi:hypothetical protein